MAWVREGINAHVQEFIEERIQSSFVRGFPILYFLGMDQPERFTYLGRADEGALFGGGNMTEAQKQEVVGQSRHDFRYQKSEPNDGRTVSFGGSTPTAGQFADDNFGTAETRWTHFMEPMKINAHVLDDAQGDTAVGKVVDDSLAPVWERAVKRVYESVWDGSLTASQQNENVWDDLLGTTHALTANNTYGRVDRSVETELNPLVIDASTDLPNTVIDLTLNRKINHGFTDEGGVVREGLAIRSHHGMGATCFLTTPDLWQELADQADARSEILHDGIPDHEISGFKFPIIRRDGVMYTYDPQCPSGEMHCLDLYTWVIEFQRGKKFTYSGLKPKHENEEGGGYYEWGQIHTKLRITCRAPWCNARITNLTTS